MSNFFKEGLFRPKAKSFTFGTPFNSKDLVTPPPPPPPPPQQQQQKQEPKPAHRTPYSQQAKLKKIVEENEDQENDKADEFLQQSLDEGDKTDIDDVDDDTKPNETSNQSSDDFEVTEVRYIDQSDQKQEPDTSVTSAEPTNHTLLTSTTANTSIESVDHLLKAIGELTNSKKSLESDFIKVNNKLMINKVEISKKDKLIDFFKTKIVVITNSLKSVNNETMYIKTKFSKMDTNITSIKSEIKLIQLDIKKYEKGLTYSLGKIDFFKNQLNLLKIENEKINNQIMTKNLKIDDLSGRLSEEKIKNNELVKELKQVRDNYENNLNNKINNDSKELQNLNELYQSLYDVFESNLATTNNQFAKLETNIMGNSPLEKFLELKELINAVSTKAENSITEVISTISSHNSISEDLQHSNSLLLQDFVKTIGNLLDKSQSDFKESFKQDHLSLIDQTNILINSIGEIKQSRNTNHDKSIDLIESKFDSFEESIDCIKKDIIAENQSSCLQISDFIKQINEPQFEKLSMSIDGIIKSTNKLDPHQLESLSKSIKSSEAELMKKIHQVNSSMKDKLDNLTVSKDTSLREIQQDYANLIKDFKDENIKFANLKQENEQLKENYNSLLKKYETLCCSDSKEIQELKNDNSRLTDLINLKNDNLNDMKNEISNTIKKNLITENKLNELKRKISANNNKSSATSKRKLIERSSSTQSQSNTPNKKLEKKVSTKRSRRQISNDPTAANQLHSFDFDDKENKDPEKVNSFELPDSSIDEIKNIESVKLYSKIKRQKKK